MYCPMGYVEEGFCVPRELSTYMYLAHVGDDKAKLSKGYVRMCCFCGDMSLFTISRLLGFSRDDERLLSNACTMSRSGPMLEQRQEARQRRTKSTQIFTQGSTKPIGNSPEAVCLLRYPQYHRNGERYRELLRSHRMRREVEAANQNFFWRTCVVCCATCV